MGVATRGVKFKFSSGEKVLCYEPDPTKAKVLYESKVLDLVIARDNRGRKVPEYLIHFFGWNSSWDRCVREEFILSFTEENRELQTKLAKEAALSIKGKRRLPPLIKETLAKKNCEDNGNIQLLESVDSGSDTDSSEKEIEVNIVIPEVLKLQLEEDHRCITKKNKRVSVPCVPNVVWVLESFVQHSLALRNGSEDEMQNRLSLCKEAMDGIRVTFDFTLPHLLLYPQERRYSRSAQQLVKTECDPLLDKKTEDGNSQPDNTVKRKRGRPKSVHTLRSGRRRGEPSSSTRGSLPSEEGGGEWRLLSPPQQDAPSLVYGPQHLLRLFVALPDLISKMNITGRKLRPLIAILEQFLAYLCEEREHLFPASAYVDCGK